MKIINLKSFIFVTFLTGILCACDCPNDTDAIIVENSSYVEVQTLIHNGHHYLWFRAKSRKGFGGVTHDPDCPKCKNK